MTVYRIELAHPLHWGRGPYNSDWDSPYWNTSILQQMMDEHQDMSTHPSHFVDRLDRFAAYACPTFELLKQWFKGYTGHLALIGFKCYAIKLPRRAVKLGISGKQCCYNSDAVISRKRISFVTGQPL